MEPLATETFGLEGGQVNSGDGEEAAVRQALPAGLEKRGRVVHMFNYLPAGDS